MAWTKMPLKTVAAVARSFWCADDETPQRTAKHRQRDHSDNEHVHELDAPCVVGGLVAT